MFNYISWVSKIWGHILTQVNGLSTNEKMTTGCSKRQNEKKNMGHPASLNHHLSRRVVISGTFTLWWTNIAMENHIFFGKIHYKWPFSIAMLVHQRVFRDPLLVMACGLRKKAIEAAQHGNFWASESHAAPGSLGCLAWDSKKQAGLVLQ